MDTKPHPHHNDVMRQFNEYPHYCIDGTKYFSINAVYADAVRRGYKKSKPALVHRLKTRNQTWVELLRDRGQKHGTQSR